MLEQTLVVPACDGGDNDVATGVDLWRYIGGDEGRRSEEGEKEVSAL